MTRQPPPDKARRERQVRARQSYLKDLSCNPICRRHNPPSMLDMPRLWLELEPPHMHKQNKKHRWGKKWGKIPKRSKTIRHKKIQPPLSDWIF